MWQKDELLHELQKKTARKKYLHGVIANLRKQERELAEKVALLDSQRKTEQNELDKLSGRSLAALFYGIAGKKDEHIAKEQREALAAQAKYDTAKRELESVRNDIKRYNAEYSQLIGYDVRYKKLLKEKAKILKLAGAEQAENIIELEKCLAESESFAEEITEAISAAKRAERSACAVLERLMHAEDWSSWDVFGGGMCAADCTELDEAQDAVELLQVDLRSLKTELADIAEELGISVYIEGFLRFSDWFFDGIFADYSILQRIEESKEKVRDIKCRIATTVERLQEKLKEIHADMAKIQSELENLLLGTEV